MPAEATTEQEHRETAPDLAAGDLIPCVRGGEYDEKELHVRFDRLEGRLTSLERMIGELLDLHHQAATVPASPHAPRILSGEPPVLGGGQADAHVLSAALPATPDSVAPAPASSPPVESDTTPPAAEPDVRQEVPVWAQRADDEELDQSVREYISQLLKQVRSPAEEPVTADTGDSAEPQDTAQSSSATAEDSPSAPLEGYVPEAAAADFVEDQPDISPAPYVLAPLSLPPEQESSLDAMREVANLSATAAIRTFEKQEAARKTFDRLPLLLVGLFCGLTLLYSAFASGKSGMFVGAGAAFLAAALTASQLLVVARRWLWASRPAELERRPGARS